MEHKRCKHCGRPVFRHYEVWKLVYVEYENTVRCDARNMEAGHEVED